MAKLLIKLGAQIATIIVEWVKRRKESVDE